MDAIGVDLGGTKLAVARVHPGGGTAAPLVTLHDSLDYDAVLDRIEARVLALRPNGSTVLGVAVAGWLSADRSRVVEAATLGWRNRSLRADLADRTGLPVALCNDADAAAWAEFVLAGRPGGGPFVLLATGTDVGGGVIVDGALVTGATGVAGELGHLCIDPSGPVCVCGGRGCLAVYASGTAVLAAARERLGPIDPDGLRTLADGGDADALSVIESAARAIAVASGQIARVLDHRTLVLGGGATVLGEVFAAAVRRAVAEAPAMGPIRSMPDVLLARAGAWSGTIGAAELARTALDERLQAEAL
jgi:glucokinase